VKGEETMKAIQSALTKEIYAFYNIDRSVIIVSKECAEDLIEFTNGLKCDIVSAVSFPCFLFGMKCYIDSTLQGKTFIIGKQYEVKP